MDEEHIGLVYHVIQELARSDETCIRAFGKDISEYLGEGYIALEIAKKNFKPELGFMFSTYATSVIRSRLIQCAKKSTLIKIGTHAQQKAICAIQGKEVKEEDTQKVKDALKVMKISSIVDIVDKSKDSLLESIEELGFLLEKLDNRARLILTMRYGLNGEEILTLEEIGKRLGITRERVRQIEKKALSKLKEIC